MYDEMTTQKCRSHQVERWYHTVVAMIWEGVLCLAHRAKLFDQPHKLDQSKYAWSDQTQISHEQAHAHCKGHHVIFSVFVGFWV